MGKINILTSGVHPALSLVFGSAPSASKFLTRSKSPCNINQSAIYSATKYSTQELYLNISQPQFWTYCLQIHIHTQLRTQQRYMKQQRLSGFNPKGQRAFGCYFWL